MEFVLMFSLVIYIAQILLVCMIHIGNVDLARRYEFAKNDVWTKKQFLFKFIPFFFIYSLIRYLISVWKETPNG